MDKLDIDSMPVLPPPRTRLLELKNGASFAPEEFNHTIKTWVNMASLLVKQGNMAESSKDDENAYISYVRACLIVTKIIPVQAHYKSMMNDIVCIDLRQKILGTVSRMGNLERRLLRRFEQESHQQEQHKVLLRFRQQQEQEQQQQLQQQYQEHESLSTEPEMVQQNPVQQLLDDENNNNDIEADDLGQEQTNSAHEPSISPPSVSSRSQLRQPRLSMLIVDGAIAKVEQRIFEHEQLQQLQQQQQQEELQRQSMESDRSLTFDHHSYVSHHHSRYHQTGSNSRSSPLAFEHVDSYSDLDDTTADQPTSDDDREEDAEDEETVVEELPKVILRIKKNIASDGCMDESILKTAGFIQNDESTGPTSTNSDEDAALGKVMPSALFAHHREGMHVRRCSSTDAISRTNSMIVYPSAASFPDIAAAAIKGSLSDPRFVHTGMNLPMIPPRSDKRSSVMTGAPGHGYTPQSSFGGGSGLQRTGSISGPISLGVGSTARSGIERDVLQNRFGPGVLNGNNRRTMSFESGRQGNHYQHQLQQQLSREQQKSRHEQQHLDLELIQAEEEVQQRPPVSQRSALHSHSSNPVVGRKADLPPAPRPSFDKISLSSSSSLGTSSSGRNGQTQMSSSQLPTPVSSPLMTSSFQLNKGVGHGSSTATLHAHSPSLASITSSTSTNATMVDSPLLLSSSSSITISSWTTIGKKAGLLRKIRSKSAMKDELFDIVVVSPPQTPSLPGQSLQQQQQQQQSFNRAQTRMATMA